MVIEAFKWTGETGNGDPLWMSMAIRNGTVYVCCNTSGDIDLRIKTLEGVMTANVGDFIIQGVAGEIYPCKPDIFEATYEKV